jgi:hypothetical protein
MVNRIEYCHILKNERVFIELYYQGRVMETAYNEWVEFMGGTLYKRLNPKVSIILTNADANELGAIMDRVRRSAPNCKVISILWFEKCFQYKKKVPFDDFELDKESKMRQTDKEKERNREQFETIDKVEVEEFLNNVAEDIELDFKDFFKENKNRFFEYPHKTAVVP